MPLKSLDNYFSQIANIPPLCPFPKSAMNHILAIFQTIHIVGIPLQHFSATIQILSVIISTANTVFIDMSQLCFYLGRIETLLMQNSAHCVAKTMSSGSAAITDTSD